jgi:hypothetical protein
MSVRAKFKCVEAKPTEGFPGCGQVRLEAVTSGEENAEWSKWTPSGDLSLGVMNLDAFKQFEVGKSYFLDFSPAE